MGAPEQAAIDRILRGMSADERLFRINAGVGWAGRVAKQLPGAVLLADPRPLRAAPAGWPDLFGWRTVTITPEMVGQRVAVARGIEVKAASPGRSPGRLRPEQARFGTMLETMGGIFEVSD